MLALCDLWGCKWEGPRSKLTRCHFGLKEMIEIPELQDEKIPDTYRVENKVKGTPRYPGTQLEGLSTHSQTCFIRSPSADNPAVNY